MVKLAKIPSRRVREIPAEALWVREFVSHYRSDNITRVCLDDLGGVSLTRVYEALYRGRLVFSDKCDEPGCVCLFEHESEDDRVQVRVFFEATTMVLEILEAEFLQENDGGRDAA